MKKSQLGPKVWRYSIIITISIFLLTPIIAMLDVSTRPFGGGSQHRTLRAWKVIPSQDNLIQAISTSMFMGIFVMVLVFILIVPTVIWVHLKLPKLRRPLELLCLLPLAIPAIVIVVGIAPLYRFISIHITESPLSLSGVYSILILPYTYRSLSAALDAADIHTLSEAARTLGASTWSMMARVIMPTLRSGIMNGTVIAIALVLGEFTISSLLNYETLQVVISQLGRSDGNVAVAVSVASLLFVLALLLIIPTTKRRKAILDVDVA